jgi:hypothetical protein
LVTVGRAGGQSPPPYHSPVPDLIVGEPLGRQGTIVSAIDIVVVHSFDWYSPTVSHSKKAVRL